MRSGRAGLLRFSLLFLLGNRAPLCLRPHTARKGRMVGQVTVTKYFASRGASAMPDNVILEVARFSPEFDTQPRFETFEVPYRPDWMVLDALNHIKDHIDGSLTFRWSWPDGHLWQLRNDGQRQGMARL
jgi:2Fe-2S iron-sulfur cluster binding domain